MVVTDNPFLTGQLKIAWLCNYKSKYALSMGNTKKPLSLPLLILRFKYALHVGKLLIPSRQGTETWKSSTISGDALSLMCMHIWGTVMLSCLQGFRRKPPLSQGSWSCCSSGSVPPHYGGGLAWEALSTNMDLLNKKEGMSREWWRLWCRFLQEITSESLSCL